MSYAQIRQVTVGKAKLHTTIDTVGNRSQKVLLYSYLNAVYESGLTNPIDEAIKQYYNDELRKSSSQYQ